MAGSPYADRPAGPWGTSTRRPRPVIWVSGPVSAAGSERGPFPEFCRQGENMDHHEQRHQHHEKEREQRIRREEESERRGENLPRKMHPAWFVVLGTVLLGLVVLTWIL